VGRSGNADAFLIPEFVGLTLFAIISCDGVFLKKQVDRMGGIA
jgi:hypothetical protein